MEAIVGEDGPFAFRMSDEEHGSLRFAFDLFGHAIDAQKMLEVLPVGLLSDVA